MVDENKKIEDKVQSEKNIDVIEIKEITLDVIDNIFGDTRHATCGSYNL